MMLERKQGSDLRGILASSILLVILGATNSANALAGCQSPGRQGPAGNAESQRDQNYDRMEQMQQQQQQEQALRDRQYALQQLPNTMWLMEAERARINQELRANFRRHYAVIRRNSDELLQLTSSLQNSVERDVDISTAHDMAKDAQSIRKLAHQIRATMGGGSVPKAKPLKTTTQQNDGTVAANSKQRLQADTRAAKTAAAELKKAIDDYLAGNNEQAVSVSALQKATDKAHVDPNSLAILKNSLQLEQLAREIRVELRGN